jgi:hypothetical protein
LLVLLGILGLLGLLGLLELLGLMGTLQKGTAFCRKVNLVHINGKNYISNKNDENEEKQQIKN